MRKFLIINPFGIGDVLFTTPVIRAIKDSLSDAFIGYWCNERVEGLLKDSQKIDKIFALSRGDLKKIYQKSITQGIFRFLSLLFAIKKEKFDIAIDFSLDHRYSLIAKLSGIKRRIGFNYKGRGRFLTEKIDIGGYNIKHVVEYYLELLKFLRIKPKTYNLDLSVSADSKIKSRAILQKSGVSENDLIIGISPGAGESWGKDAFLKHWPAINFAKLIDAINNGFKAKVLLLGDESERPIADIIVKTAHSKIIDLIGKTNLDELIGTIDNLDILIANDGGPLHIAAALGKKTVSFYGPVDPRVYGPYPPDERQHLVLKQSLGCSPCYSQFRLSKCLRDKECLKKIDVNQAVRAVSALLSGKGNI